MILDSSYLIALGNDDSDAFDKGVELSERDIVQWLPTPVITELVHGVELTGSPEERRQTENVVLLYPHVEIEEDVARRAGELLAQADSDAGGAGQSGVDYVDAQVGAIADTFGDAVLTDNVDDFRALGVGVETW